MRAIYPPVNLFEDIADPADWELIATAEAKTDFAVRDPVGAIHLVPPTFEPLQRRRLWRVLRR